MSGFAADMARQLKGAVLIEEPLKKHTTWRIGGPAEVLAIPESQAEVLTALRVAAEWHKQVFVVGNGSNLLALDEGVRGLVLKLAGGLSRWSLDGKRLTAESGCPLSGISRATVERGLSGLEFAVGIPASLGGALTMNAGAHGGELGTLVKEVQVSNLQGELRQFNGEECGFGYRTSSFQNSSYIILSAILDLQPGDAASGKRLIKDNLQKRALAHPMEYPNAGSIFRNPPGTAAAKLIEEAGLKGLQIGGAMISTKHANFIVNVGGATAKDVQALIERVKNTVLEKFQVELHPEIRTLGCSRD